MSTEGRISLSRDTLRAELAEMELRLRIWIGEALEEKADLAVITEHGRRIADLQNRAIYRDGPLAQTLESFREGEFTPAQIRNIETIVNRRNAQARQETFSFRERTFAIIGAVATLVGIVGGVLFILHNAGAL